MLSGTYFVTACHIKGYRHIMRGTQNVGKESIIPMQGNC